MINQGLLEKKGFLKVASENKPLVTLVHSTASKSEGPSEDDVAAAGGIKASSMVKGSFQMLSFRNVPECFGDSFHEIDEFVRGVNEPNVHCGSVFLRLAPAKADLKSTKGVNIFVESLKEAPQATHSVTGIDVIGGPTEEFHVLIDGVPHGPFRKISIAPNDVCTDGVALRCLYLTNPDCEWLLLRFHNSLFCRLHRTCRSQALIFECALVIGWETDEGGKGEPGVRY